MAYKNGDPSGMDAFVAYTTYMQLIVWGYIRDFLGYFFNLGTIRPKSGYAPLLVDFEDFFTRRLYHRIQDCWNRPIASCPGAWMDIMLRSTNDNNKTLTLTGETRRVLNLGSYNYLGFGDPNSPTKPDVLQALEQYAVSTGSVRTALGTTKLHLELERLVARFVGKEDAMIFGMGFGTNSTGLPALIGQGGLIISDANNHSSLVAGSRSSGAKVKVFKHNDPVDLERVIRRAIIEGQPRKHRQWNKIMIVVEGIYSMEGEVCKLKEIIALKQKYRCYLYVDEAHSIGALGHTGRGVCEATGVDPKDVDVLMGTFTKAFGAVGGYIASNSAVIDHLRRASAGSLYSQSISPPACKQVISAMKIMLGEDGTQLGQQKLAQLRDNANYFRAELMKLGFIVLGDFNSPVIPIMLYTPTKLAAFSRLCLEKSVAVVVVGFPATPLLLGRSRVCISAAHTREDMQRALKVLSEVGDDVWCKQIKRIASK